MLQSPLPALIFLYKWKCLAPGCWLVMEISLPAWLLVLESTKLETSWLLEHEWLVTDGWAFSGDSFAIWQPCKPAKQKPISIWLSVFIYCPVFLKHLYLRNLLSQDVFAMQANGYITAPWGEVWESVGAYCALWYGFVRLWDVLLQDQKPMAPCV